MMFPQVNDPEDVPVAPLTAGVVANMVPRSMPKGTVLDARGLIANTRGLFRWPAPTLFAAGASFSGNAVDLITLYESATQKLMYLVTDGKFYAVNTSSGYTEVDYVESAGTISISSGTTAVVGVATDFTRLKHGDVLTVGTDVLLVDSASDATHLSVQTNATADHTGAAFSVSRLISATGYSLPDWAIVDSKLVVTDLGNEPRYIEAGDTQFTEFASDYELGVFKAETIEEFYGRVVVAHLIDGSDGEVRNRIRWSDILDKTNFNLAKGYIDLPGFSGHFRRLKRNGNMIVAYAEDAIFYGTLTSDPDLPIDFNQIETGGIGLAGSRGLVGLQDGHFFVGQDDIYFFSNNGFTRIGSNVIQRTVGKCQRPWRVMACADPYRQRVLFGFPNDGDAIEEIWSYNLFTKAWSMLPVNTMMIANPTARASYTLGDFGSLTLGDVSLSGVSLGSLDQTQQVRQVYVEAGGTIQQYADETAIADVDGNPIEVVIELPSTDFGASDVVKTMSRVSVKIFESSPIGRTSNIEFQVWGTTNEGIQYRLLGTLKIKPNTTRGWVNFKLTSSVMGIKLVSTSKVPCYTVDEISLRVTDVGQENGVESQAVV